MQCDSLKVIWFGIHSNQQSKWHIVYVDYHIGIFSNPRLCDMLCLTLSFPVPVRFSMIGFDYFLDFAFHVGAS